jgi:hypothetical protein
VTARSPQAPDELEAARAIRRALAAQGLKARDVGLIAVWATGALARERAEVAVAMGLGRFAAGIPAVFDDPNPFARCAAAIAEGEAQVAVALIIDPVAGNRALAFGRPAQPASSQSIVK